jgi:hypothetical protein
MDKHRQIMSSPQLQLKLREGAGGPAREAVFRSARDAGALDIRPLFPAHKDDTLASMYTIDADSLASVSKIMKKLQGHKAVEFVEPGVKRKLKIG